MKHWKETPDGRDREEQIDVQPRILSEEEIERQIAEGGREGGGGGPRAVPPAQGPEVEVDPHWPNLRLPDHPVGEGWIESDPSEPLWPKDKE